MGGEAGRAPSGGLRSCACSRTGWGRHHHHHGRVSRCDDLVCVFDTDKLCREINKVVNKYFDQGVAELVEMRMAESVDVMIWCVCVCV